MPPALREEHEYLGYKIRVTGDANLSGCAAAVRLTGLDGRVQCTFHERLDSALQGSLADWPNDDKEAVKQLVERAFHRARGAILLDRVNELNGGEFWVPKETPYAGRSDEYVRRVILRALERVIRLSPHSHGHVFFDDLGVCLSEDIDPNQMDYVLARLERAHLVEYWAMGDARGNRTLRATDGGLLAADQLVVERNAPGFLLEESIAKVETTLNKYKPELVESLRRQSVRVAEARELGEYEVGEIAQACEQVIWDFLDLDVLWQGVEAERPPKGKTRDRLRAILEAKVPSETERDLLAALENYLVG